MFALFFHLLQFHEAWELQGSLRRRPPPTSELPALPQMAPRCPSAQPRGWPMHGDVPLELVSSFQGHCKEAGCGLGVALPPASPSWLLPEEPEGVEESRPSPSAPPQWVHGPPGTSETFHRPSPAEHWALLCPPSLWRALAQETQTGLPAQMLRGGLASGSRDSDVGYNKWASAAFWNFPPRGHLLPLPGVTGPERPSPPGAQPSGSFLPLDV